MNLAKQAAAILIAAILVSCTPPPEPKLPPAPVAAKPKAMPAPPPPLAAPKPAPDLVMDERAVAVAQRALNQLGYDAGKPDGIGGPATRRAILAFQRDHELAEDGRLTFAVAEKLKAALASEASNIGAILVHPGDLLVFSDGVTEFVSGNRMVQWDEEDTHGLVAIRPSVTGWPAAARAGLDWAITHALDVPAAGAPVKWSSTGVDQQYEIFTSALAPREAALVGGDAGSCRRFEMRTAERQVRYPAIACRDENGSWYIPHSTIRLARPASGLPSIAPNAKRN